MEIFSERYADFDQLCTCDTPTDHRRSPACQNIKVGSDANVVPTRLVTEIIARMTAFGCLSGVEAPTVRTTRFVKRSQCTMKS